jgi:phosphoribosylformimino-5-aminoimidazole carboxamide ribotide isomerase
MLLLPAIDLMDGEAVRLRQGRAEDKTVYSKDAVAVAKRWEDEGGDWLHLVDLDSAFSGVSSIRNRAVIAAIVRALKIPVELGGGIRDEETVRIALEDLGVSRVIIGTRAAESLDFVRALVERFGGNRVAVGIDAKEGFVALRGWTEVGTQTALELALQVQELGVGAIIYTDIATDGMLSGPNYAALDELLKVLTCPLIASGGIASIDCIKKLSSREKLHGAILGRALYENQLSLVESRSLMRLQ